MGSLKSPNPWAVVVPLFQVHRSRRGGHAGWNSRRSCLHPQGSSCSPLAWLGWEQSTPSIPAAFQHSRASGTGRPRAWIPLCSCPLTRERSQELQPDGLKITQDQRGPGTILEQQSRAQPGALLLGPDSLLRWKTAPGSHGPGSEQEPPQGLSAAPSQSKAAPRGKTLPARPRHLGAGPEGLQGQIPR